MRVIIAGAVQVGRRVAANLDTTHDVVVIDTDADRIDGLGYLEFPVTSKLLMIVLMWLGRLEVVPVLVLFTRSFWRW